MTIAPLHELLLSRLASRNVFSGFDVAGAGKTDRTAFELRGAGCSIVFIDDPDAARTALAKLADDMAYFKRMTCGTAYASDYSCEDEAPVKRPGRNPFLRFIGKGNDDILGPSPRHVGTNRRGARAKTR